MTTDTDIIVELEPTPRLPGLRARRGRREAAEHKALSELIIAANRHDGRPWSPTPAHVRDDLENDPGLDPVLDVVVVELEDRVVGFAQVERVVRDGVAIYHCSGFVHPSIRRRGLGRALLHENIRRAAERAVGDPDDLPRELGAFAETQELGHQALLASEGFETLRWFFLMRRDLTEPIPDAPLPDGLDTRPLTEDQHRIVFDAEVEAFRDHWGAREKLESDFVRTYALEEFVPSLWVVAWDADQVAGVVQNWIWTAENATTGIQRGWLEHISVRRPWRRRGLARAITAMSLRRLREAGMTEAMLGVDSENANGALGLYESLGFSIYTRSSAFRRSIDREASAG